MHDPTLSRIIHAVLFAASASACSSSEGAEPGTGGTGNPSAGTTSAGAPATSGGALGLGGAAGGALGNAGANHGAGQTSGGATSSGGSGGALGGAGGSTGGSAGKDASGGKGGEASAGKGGDGGASGGSTTGGASGGAGGPATAGAGGGSGLIPLKNEPVKSSGCDKPTQVTSGEKMITSKGRQRSYTIDVPANYDMSHPHKLVYASHWIGSNDESVVRQNYYHLKPKAMAANEKIIWVAPQALPGNPNGTWASGPNDDVDHVFFDDILAFVKSNLCIDTTRVFAIGFSFGGMQTYSLSTNHQKDIRAAFGIAPANYNIYVPPKTNLPIAWMQTTGLGDNTTPWDRNGGGATDGAKFIALEHAKNNGCTLPADIPTWKSGEYLCYAFEGCNPSTPTKACTFNGGHESTDGRPWIAEEAWKFFMQF